MSLLLVVLVLVVEQVHPLEVARWVERPLSALAAYLERHFNDGRAEHGMLAWGLGAALPALCVFIVDAFLQWWQPVLGFLFSFLALYLTMGFRQFSHHFTAIQLALQDGDVDFARRELAHWAGRNCDQLSSEEISRLAIETGLIASHRHVFAPLLAFVALGPAGAVLYRLADALAKAWQESGERSGDHAFGRFARRAFDIIDWLPVRATAAGFAIVGDFEDAAYCWRTQARRWGGTGSGILLSSGAGALGVRLGMPMQGDATPGGRCELGLGEAADADLMQSTIGLVWRTLVLTLVLVALVHVSGWIHA